MELELELGVLAGPGDKAEDEGCQLFQRRTSIEKCHLVASLGELHRKAAHERRPEPRLLLHPAIDDAQRNALQDNLGQRFGAAELRLVLAETNEMSGKAKRDDLAATVSQQAVKPHHSAHDPID